MELAIKLKPVEFNITYRLRSAYTKNKDLADNVNITAGKSSYKEVDSSVKIDRFNSAEAIKLRNRRNDSYHYWLFNKKVYVTDDERLTPDDVRALLNEAENRRRIQLEKAHALQAMANDLKNGTKRATLPKEVKLAVWQRDKGLCVTCGSQEKLEFDHVIPLAMGGSNTERNLQLLCETCNRRKGASLG